MAVAPQQHAFYPASVSWREIPTWDGDQLIVIEAQPCTRNLISAGPGTGKTEVACARVAHLLEAGIPGSAIWFVSFTRTAVREIRDRMEVLAKGNSEILSVRINTLDSQAWQLRQGFGVEDTGSLFDGYEASIDRATALFNADNDQLADYLSRVKHLLVDEAQDIVGTRAEMVQALIRALPRESGVTVFHDPAQAIYGFTADAVIDATALPGRLLAAPDRTGFVEMQLRTVHRTSSHSLRSIFTKTRRIVPVGPAAKPADYAALRDSIMMHADSVITTPDHGTFKGDTSAFILFRTRAEVLQASSMLWQSGIDHRVRMSGLPALAEPWIGILLRDHTGRYLRESQFRDLWQERIPAAAQHDTEICWRTLNRLAGTGRRGIDIGRLATRLSRNPPPVEVTVTEPGQPGPLLGTIHGSKGREADTVLLALPPADGFRPEQAAELAEECRVMFVGATRARGTLHVCDAKKSYAGILSQDGRAVRKLSKHSKGMPRAQVEIGKTRDINVRLQVSQFGNASTEDTYQAQRLLCEHAWSSAPLTARMEGRGNWTYQLFLTDDDHAPPIGFLNGDEVNRALFSVAKGFGPRHKLPDEIRHLWVIGSGTAAIAPDDPLRQELHQPFAESGIFLVPVISGFPTVIFPWKIRRY
ncbi:UvrD-helicase domain-containing protein [Imhoffiella purpurea]|uniref:Uncharacterized protein n=1 Tax=Imhoffiella purpurea TaxID=1249627 RepID=W9V9M4_9GAMM|nr:UvrD-helicase domain-containing protein [Imhoffiella purpurea]EXJ13586.1 hypothetical protein D779_3589 [Imhoffiella purpurea]